MNASFLKSVFYISGVVFLCLITNMVFAQDESSEESSSEGSSSEGSSSEENSSEEVSEWEESQKRRSEWKRSQEEQSEWVRSGGKRREAGGSECTNNCDCGIPPTHPTVAVIANPTPNELHTNITKFTCTIVYQRTPIASGVIISKHFALTTCKGIYTKVITHPLLFEDIEVAWGTFKSEANGMVTMISPARRVFPGPECDTDSQELSSKGDIAVIQTVKRVVDYGFLQYAHLPKSTQFAWCPIRINQYMLLSNFKYTDVATDITEAVWMIKTPLLKSEICSVLLNNSVYDPLMNFCTAYTHEDGLACCELDIGAALSHNNMICGLLSFKVGCGKAHSVGSFVSISRQAAWIRKIVDQASNGEEAI